jgi:hypothetical protein
VESEELNGGRSLRLPSFFVLAGLLLGLAKDSPREAKSTRFGSSPVLKLLIPRDRVMVSELPLPD